MQNVGTSEEEKGKELTWRNNCPNFTNLKKEMDSEAQSTPRKKEIQRGPYWNTIIKLSKVKEKASRESSLSHTTELL